MSTDANQSMINEREEGGYSFAKKHSIIYTWTINEISSWIKSAKSTQDDVFMDSPCFSTGSKIKDSWYIRLKIKNDGDESKSKSWISLYLMRTINDRQVRTKYIFFFLNDKREKILHDRTLYNQSSGLWINKLFDDSTLAGWGLTNLVKIDTLLEKGNGFLHNDTLIVGVDLTVYDDYVTVNSPNNLLEGSKRKLSDDFEDLFESKKKCDIIIKVGDQKFDVHKFILTARSSVFDAMFSHDMKENKENEVTIPDVNPEVFKKVLKYMYTDKIDDLMSFAEELLEAADKYQLHGLKSMCECSLSKTLTPGNAMKILILADLHYAKRLEEVAINFIANNWINFKNTEEFKQLEKSHSALAYAVVKKIVDKNEDE